METILAVIGAVSVGALAVWGTVRLAAFVKADGYGFRAASGLPRDWSPSPDLPSTPYVQKAHR
ncbi:MAG: hypothetical protein H0U36_02590 [Nocardioidaceae bacterium]|nr:hypothetical protein [Nocardioidaceae bacterium]